MDYEKLLNCDTCEEHKAPAEGAETTEGAAEEKPAEEAPAENA